MAIGVMLQALGLGGDVGGILQYLADIGFFTYVLPFLLVFALVFGILTRIKVFGDHTGVNIIIAFSVGLISLQFGYVTDFFSVILPYTGIGLAIILSMLILTGLFITDKSRGAMMGIYFGIGALIFLVIVFNSLDDAYLFQIGYYDWQGPLLIGLLVVGALVTVVAATKSGGGGGGGSTAKFVRMFDES